MIGAIIRHGSSSSARAALACILCTWAGCGRPTRGYDSPQAAFDASVAAYRAREWGTVYDALTAESQQEKVATQLCEYQLSEGSLAVLKELSRDLSDDRVPELMADARARYDKLSKLLKDHNVPADKLPEDVDVLSDDWPELFPKLAALVPDQRAFFIDFLERTKTFEARTEPSERDSKLKSLTVDGDIARGEVEGGLQLFGPHPIEFRKTGGRWLIHTADLSRQHMNARIRAAQPD